MLGRLVFASQVVWNGRPFMQSMLSAFAGMSVDWHRGTITWRDGVRRQRVPLSPSFWEDVRWWRQHLSERFSMPWEPEPRAEAAVTGTDASGWGTGQLAWLDGAREEAVLKFTRAEQRRPVPLASWSPPPRLGQW